MNKAIRAIKGSLGAGEGIIAAVWAQDSGNGARGALVLTNLRLIYSGGAWFGAGTNQEWRLPQLIGISATKTLRTEHIEINAGGPVVKFLVQYRESMPFVEKVNTELLRLMSSSAQPKTKSGGGGLGESLEKIADLFDRGLLSEDEFLSAKRRLLEG